MPGAGGDFWASQQLQSKNAARKCGECRGRASPRCGAAPARKWGATKFWNQGKNCSGRRRQSRGSRKQGGKGRRGTCTIAKRKGRLANHISCQSKRDYFVAKARRRSSNSGQTGGKSRRWRPDSRLKGATR